MFIQIVFRQFFLGAYTMAGGVRTSCEMLVYKVGCVPGFISPLVLDQCQSLLLCPPTYAEPDDQ